MIICGTYNIILIMLTWNLIINPSFSHHMQGTLLGHPGILIIITIILFFGRNYYNNIKLLKEFRKINDGMEYGDWVSIESNSAQVTFSNTTRTNTSKKTQNRI